MLRPTAFMLAEVGPPFFSANEVLTAFMLLHIVLLNSLL
jgi:hypothetical protein